MSGHPHEGIPEDSVPTEVTSSSSEGQRIIILQAPSSFDSLEALPFALGSIPSHNISPKEALEVGQANYVGVIKLIEGSNAEERRESRVAEFELRANNMGITEAGLVAQKVAIWEGMWAAEQGGNDIELQYDAWVLLDTATSADQ